MDDPGTEGPDMFGLVVVGASAGGLEPLAAILGDLDASFSAPILVAMHLGPESHLPEILQRRSSLQVVAAEDGMSALPGHVYVATPGNHLAFEDGMLNLQAGPRHNRSVNRSTRRQRGLRPDGFGL
jgi:two-component system, chemotaxis family, protein-glutamate methylesterase/glutaminase